MLFCYFSGGYGVSSEHMVGTTRWASIICLLQSYQYTYDPLQAILQLMVAAQDHISCHLPQCGGALSLMYLGARVKGLGRWDTFFSRARARQTMKDMQCRAAATGDGALSQHGQAAGWALKLYDAVRSHDAFSAGISQGPHVSLHKRSRYPAT
jgi:hypothetical protein